MRKQTQEQFTVEWDSEKNNENKRKHGISLETAALVFGDPLRIELFDEVHSDYENRYVVIGCIGKVIFVVYTQRDDVSRLISARMATKREKDIYYGNY